MASFVLCFFLLRFRCHLTLLFHDHRKASSILHSTWMVLKPLDGHGDGARVGVRVRCWEHGWWSVSFSGLPMASDHNFFSFQQCMIHLYSYNIIEG